jgi:hypothetical protein
MRHCSFRAVPTPLYSFPMNSAEFRKSLTWGKRIVLVLAVLLGLCYGVLTLAERSKDAIRLGLQDYLVQISGQEAEVTDMAQVQFVPDMIFHMKGIVLRDPQKKEKPLLKAEEAYFAMPFWRMAVGRNGYIGIEMRKLEVASGFFLPKKTVIGFAGITDPSPEKKPAQFLIEGSYNKRDVLVTAQIERFKGHKRPLYRFGDEFPITVKLGTLEGAGTFKRGFTGSSVPDAIFTRDGIKAEMQITDIGRDDDILAGLKGKVDGAGFNGQLREKEGRLVLSISPEEKGDEKVAAFFGKIKNDLALSGEQPEKFAIDIEKKE